MQRPNAGLVHYFLLVCCLLALSLAAPHGLSRGAAALQPTPDPRFGIVEAFVNPEAAAETGAGYTRVILRWDVFQPTGPNDWQPANVPDPYIEAELAAGREVVGLLIGTPPWARDPARTYPEAVGDPGSRAVPDMFHWEAFVRRVAQHYQGRIHHWIIWNEPDVWDPGHPGATWAGTETDYAALLETAYRAIKDVDPSLQVLVAGLTYYWDWEHGRRQYLDRLLEAIRQDPDAANHGYYFDAVVYHLYFNPRQTVHVLGEARDTLRKYGIGGKEIWINETNAPPSEDPQELPWSAPRFQVSMEEQAAFVIQEYALAFAAGASRVEVYKLRNSAEHPESIEPFGLLRADDSRRPAFAAYQVVTKYLGGFEAVQRQVVSDVEAITFARGEESVTVLWTWGRNPVQVQVQAAGVGARLVNELGNVQEVEAADGAYKIELPGAICSHGAGCFIGGAPRLLVQTGSVDGQRALVPCCRGTASQTPPTQETSSPFTVTASSIRSLRLAPLWIPASGATELLTRTATATATEARRIALPPRMATARPTETLTDAGATHPTPWAMPSKASEAGGASSPTRGISARAGSTSQAALDRQTGHLVAQDSSSSPATAATPGEQSATTPASTRRIEVAAGAFSVLLVVALGSLVARWRRASGR